MKQYTLRPLPETVEAVQFYRENPAFPGLMYFGPPASDGHRVWAYFWARGDTSDEKNAVDIVEGDWIIFENGVPVKRVGDETFQKMYRPGAKQDE